MTNTELKFLEITGINHDLTIFPITELIQFPVRKELSKSHGEVFTPLKIVDHMIELSTPTSDKFNMDLCAGRGQYTIRMLRYFMQNEEHFNQDEYLKEKHWFNEFNPDSAKELLYIFGNDINLAVGPAQKLTEMPEDENGIWNKGIYVYNGKKWVKSDHTLTIKNNIALF